MQTSQRFDKAKVLYYINAFKDWTQIPDALGAKSHAKTQIHFALFNFFSKMFDHNSCNTFQANIFMKNGKKQVLKNKYRDITIRKNLD